MKELGAEAAAWRRAVVIRAALVSAICLPLLGCYPLTTESGHESEPGDLDRYPGNGCGNR